MLLPTEKSLEVQISAMGVGARREGWSRVLLLAFSSDEETEAQRGEGNQDKPTQLADLSGH